MLEEKHGPSLPSFPLSIIHPLGPLFRHLPLALRRHLLYMRATSRWGNFRNPRLWSEKMQWRILNDRRPILSWTADKLAQKEYVCRQLNLAGMSDYVKTPTIYWVGTDIRELQQISHLLPSRWVLKPNHSSGRFKLLDTERTHIDWDDLVRLGDEWVKSDEEELVLGHWAYGKARHALIAEERVGVSTEPDAEVKGWTFSGKMHTFTIFHTLSKNNANYSRDYQRILSGHERELPVHVPTKFELIPITLRDNIRAIAELLASPFDHVRVDFFVENEVIWFNELSTYARGGIGRINNEIESSRGNRWILPDPRALDPREEEWTSLLGSLPRGIYQMPRG